VPRDGQQPRPSIAAGEPVDAAKGTQAGVLNDILGIRGIADNPARKRLRIAEVRQHHPAKARLIVLVACHATSGSTPIACATIVT
jgi:hypothetical protein